MSAAPRAITLNLSLAVIGLIAIFATNQMPVITVSATTTTSPAVCQFDSSIPQGIEIQPAKAARSGECAVILEVKHDASISIRAAALKEPVLVVDGVQVWTNFQSLQDAQKAACEHVKSAHKVGIKVSTDLRCYNLRLGGLVRS